MPQRSEADAWVKTFRQQVKTNTGDGWYVRNNRGRMRLNVAGHGSLALDYKWSLEGSTQALPFIMGQFLK